MSDGPFGRMKSGPIVPMTFHEVATHLIRARDIHEGYWRVYVKFGPTMGINANIETTQGSALFPAAVVPIMELGLQREETPSQLSVNAAAVNPRKSLIAVPTLQ